MKFMISWEEFTNESRQILENRKPLKVPTSDHISVWKSEPKVNAYFY